MFLPWATLPIVVKKLLGGVYICMYICTEHDLVVLGTLAG